ncbi:MAG: PP2C family protein-serine/threonine phosphatase [Nocardioidaceae bacterium]
MTGDQRAPRTGAALAALVLVVLVAVDLASRGPGFVPAPLLVLSPLVACSVLGPRQTALFSGAAIVLAFLSEWWNDTWGTAQQVVRTVDVVVLSLSAVMIAVVRVRREKRFDRMAAIAQVAQGAILPTLPAEVHDVAAAARYLSAAQDASVGGDLYDCYFSDDRTRFLIGDVRGKGIGAVEQAARVIRAFRQSAAIEDTMPDVARQISRYLMAFFDDEEFATALLLDTSDRGRLVLVSCGHPPPLLVHPDGTGTLLEAPAGLPLGLADDVYECRTAEWHPGDRLLMYTDGLSEARDGDGEFLSVPDLAPLITHGTVEEAVAAVLQAVQHHVPGGRLGDDLAVILLENEAVPDRPVPAHRASVIYPGSRAR